MKLFTDFSLSPALLKACEKLGFTQPTEIQEKALPILLDTKNVDFHGQAQTGTGKTLAFGIPLINKIDLNNKSVQALIVAPTRELVVQICQSLKEISQFTNVVIAPIYGGVSMLEQMHNLKRGVHIVVGTPGRLNDHIRRKTLVMDKTHTLVLDEADLMLDMGFKEEVDEILLAVPKNRNIWLFSATVKSGIRDIMKDHMQNTVTVSVSKQQVTTSNTKQYFSIIPMRDRSVALCRFIDSAPQFYGFIFCPTKLLTAEIAEKLLQRGYKAAALHGDMDQPQRNRVIKKFREREFDVLVATDVAARGIDVSDVTHVVNFAVPEDQESYVHRVGRTGRAGKDGIAITFVNRNELHHLFRLGKKFNLDLQPLDVPSEHEIVNARLKETNNFFASVAERSPADIPYGTQIKGIVDQLSDEQVRHALVVCMQDKFLKDIELENETSFGSTVAMSRTAQTSETADIQEICLNVGLDDGIDRADVIAACKTYANLSEDQLLKLRVINKRSFLTMPISLAHQVRDSLQGIILGGRRVVARLSQDTGDFGNRRFGGRQGFGNGGGERSGRPYQGGGYARRRRAY